MKILIVTDVWRPQVNGVVRCQEAVLGELKKMGHDVLVVHPGMFRSVPYPLYKEIRFSLFPSRKLRKIVSEFSPDRIHISTEGPLGLAARRICVSAKISFTTAYHTHFPQYLWEQLRIPEFLSWPFFRWFHGKSSRVLASSETTAGMLRKQGISKAIAWTRGIDRSVFFERERENLGERPILLHAGRVSSEKNLPAFLNCSVHGTKVVVGDGPIREKLEKQFPNVKFLGWRFGEELAKAYSSADVLVFPSRTDTFGMVMIEANACGTPIAAYNVCGPVDIVKNGENGWLDEDLDVAIQNALSVSRKSCVKSSLVWDWEIAAKMLLEK
jgi:glycosyltransferase involved in cell wall biosynthesis